MAGDRHLIIRHLEPPWAEPRSPWHPLIAAVTIISNTLTRRSMDSFPRKGIRLLVALEVRGHARRQEIILATPHHVAAVPVRSRYREKRYPRSLVPERPMAWIDP